jgi:excisionase family DNA binding protein
LDREELLSLAEAAALSGMHPAHLRKLAERGDLEARKIGRMWVTTRRAVEAYMGDVRKRGNDPWKRKR